MVYTCTHSVVTASRSWDASTTHPLIESSPIMFAFKIALLSTIFMSSTPLNGEPGCHRIKSPSWRYGMMPPVTGSFRTVDALNLQGGGVADVSSQGLGVSLRRKYSSRFRRR